MKTSYIILAALLSSTTVYANDFIEQVKPSFEKEESCMSMNGRNMTIAKSYTLHYEIVSEKNGKSTTEVSKDININKDEPFLVDQKIAISYPSEVFNHGQGNQIKEAIINEGYTFSGSYTNSGNSSYIKFKSSFNLNILTSLQDVTTKENLTVQLPQTFAKVIRTTIETVPYVNSELGSWQAKNSNNENVNYHLRVKLLEKN